MNTPLPASDALEVQGLIDAITHNQGDDSLMLVLSPSQWETLASYMQPVTMAAGQMLFKQGATDRTLYFVESGSLSVHFEDRQGHTRLATIGAGSAVGEGGFFSHMPRSATVQVGSACRLWSLSPMRFAELSHRKPEIALQVAMAAGSVVAKRLFSSKYRAAVT
ncbi:Crp/Fnr family transcriptional regulator [Rhodoferax koreense]|uniref:Crp/Fnr family transcriptional regulator n=1 Tax=Rhodoferax koreensis TaxID=1842727 RepID=A0A1P8K2Y8_9BURK|nr:cyclic nucleotide-binding domain-containing protein [Rhodoferax koreense]APW40357.1 Crp/Fnr family transcriptional regulator [Rhodoferax koreense]